SSLVVALGALLNGNTKSRKKAAEVFGEDIAKSMYSALSIGKKGWRILPVVARRDNPVTVIGEAIKNTGLISRQPRGGWTETRILDALNTAVIEKPKTYGGLVLFIDEMGKFLESAAQD